MHTFTATPLAYLKKAGDTMPVIAGTTSFVLAVFALLTESRQFRQTAAINSEECNTFILT